MTTQNTSSNEAKRMNPSQKDPGHSDNSLASTDVLFVPCNQRIADPLQELDKTKKKKKKKSRGNRKAQHKRRRLRRQLRKGNDNDRAMEPNVLGEHNDHIVEPPGQQIQVGASFL
jgi:ATP-dependent protease HslVU (ClpYQ) ATPase subunit